MESNLAIMIAQLLSGVFLVAVLLSGFMRSYARRLGLMDVPNARSSHTVATPRGGGVAIVLAVLAGLTAAGLLMPGMISVDLVAGVMTASLLVAVIGYLDDHGHVPPLWRILVHFVAAGVVVFQAGSLPSIVIFGIEIVPGPAGSLVVVVLLVWMLNLYNFMDGIDGIAGVETVTTCIAAAALLWWSAEPDWALPMAVYAAASLGFLVWNWPPAKIFMGDAGSGFLGFSLATLAVVIWIETGFPFQVWLILLGVFMVDAMVTLLRRVAGGERFYQAHRSHAYQHAARHFGAHAPVTLAVALINLLWLFPLAWLALVFPHRGMVITMVAWLPLLVLAIVLRAGLPEGRRNAG